MTPRSSLHRDPNLKLMAQKCTSRRQLGIRSPTAAALRTTAAAACACEARRIRSRSHEQGVTGHAFLLPYWITDCWLRSRPIQCQDRPVAKHADLLYQYGCYGSMSPPLAAPISPCPTAHSVLGVGGERRAHDLHEPGSKFETHA
jgi:hypothetical protein